MPLKTIIGSLKLQHFHLEFHKRRLPTRFVEFTTIPSLQTYRKSGCVKFEHRLWLVGVELLDMHGVHWTTGEGYIICRHRRETTNYSWWPIHMVIRIAKCVWDETNILFSIKLDTWICVPQFKDFIIIIIQLQGNWTPARISGPVGSARLHL